MYPYLMAASNIDVMSLYHFIVLAQKVLITLKSPPSNPSSNPHVEPTSIITVVIVLDNDSVWSVIVVVVKCVF
ncbi:CPS_collapsed_G0017470.mRNA.1.CDS.1 [Saccharomyces cerevisiae]|nr:CPS_collapsed_G0017470.mRNA.1.CDS.1 [Saccharomyces cerevisiae]